MFGPCGLCGNQTDLRHGHIVPDFFDRRLRADAGTPFMRGSDPNRRIQSGPKMWLLCGACEDVFSDAESEFAKTVYHPTLDGQAFEIVWTRSLARFVVSITWRNTIKTIREHKGPVEGVWTTDNWAAIESAEARLRKYLLGQIPHPCEIEHHVFVSGSNARTAHDGVNTFLNMGTSLGMPATECSVYSVVTVPGMLLTTLLNPTDECRRMWRKGTLVVPGGLFRNYQQTIEDGHVGYYLVESANRFAEQRTRITEKQRAVIRKAATRYKTMGTTPSERIAHATLQDYDNRLETERSRTV
jgi:hypothetical protein